MVIKRLIGPIGRNVIEHNLNSTKLEKWIPHFLIPMDRLRLQVRGTHGLKYRFKLIWTEIQHAIIHVELMIALGQNNEIMDNLIGRFPCKSASSLSECIMLLQIIQWV